MHFFCNYLVTSHEWEELHQPYQHVERGVWHKKLGKGCYTTRLYYYFTVLLLTSDKQQKNSTQNKVIYRNIKKVVVIAASEQSKAPTHLWENKTAN